MHLEFDMPLKELAEQIVFWATMAPQDSSYLYNKLIEFIIDIDDGLADQDFTDKLRIALAEL